MTLTTLRDLSRKYFYNEMDGYSGSRMMNFGISERVSAVSEVAMSKLSQFSRVCLTNASRRLSLRQTKSDSALLAQGEGIRVVTTVKQSSLFTRCVILERHEVPEQWREVCVW